MNTALYDEKYLLDLATSKIEKESYFATCMDLLKNSLDTSKYFKVKKHEYSLFISSFYEFMDKLEVAPSMFIPSKIRSFSSDNSTRQNVKYFCTENFLKEHKGAFVALLNSTKADDDDFGEVENVFESLLKEDKDGALKLLEEVYVTSLESTENVDNLQVGILKLLCSYSYEELKPSAQLIVAASYNIKSIRVKSAVFNVFGHWANIESLNMLRKFEEPVEPWLRMKYRALINSIQKKYAIRQKD